MKLEKKQSLIKGLKSKNEQHNVLLEGLGKSVALEILWPGIFVHGRVSGRRIGRSPKSHDLFVVTAGNGEVREFNYDDVPEVLK